ncbi:MAG: NfeD family protein [Dokdonella sp.]|jgi:membrane protein implicated in regulation of membrane protease activity|nr:MAG: NfeD family protein [Dokdonella sp.]
MNGLLGHYGWWLLALALIGVEMIAPGYFMLWIGIAAAVMGVVTWLVPAMPALLQAVLFAAFGVAACLLYWKYLRPLAERRNDQPLLNRRGDRMIGRQVIVSEAFVNGRGKVKVGDGEWLAEGGEDVAVGTTVEVVALRGTTLVVRTVHDPA